MERKHNRPGLESRPGLAKEEEKTMARKDPGPKADRRRFLTGVVAAGAPPAAAPGSFPRLLAQTTPPPPALPPPRQGARALGRSPPADARRESAPRYAFPV